MLTSTFLHLPRIGVITEQRLWRQGITTWDAFLKAATIPGISSRRKISYNLSINKSIHALSQDDCSYFSTFLPSHAAWRLWSHFCEDAVFLDIETTGYYGDVTIVGLHGQHGTTTLVRGRNLSKETLAHALSPYRLIVTFNGASFDLPVLSRYFNMPFNVPHIDLRTVCRQAGLTGGLKHIEHTMGLQRPEHIQDMDGYHAVLLWDTFRRTGKEEYLKTLIDYNLQDVLNLKPLAETIIPQLWNKTFL